MKECMIAGAQEEHKRCIRTQIECGSKARNESMRVQKEHERYTLGENCALAANQSVDCRATILFTISLNFVKQRIQLAFIRCRNAQEIS